ncbi:MAG: hypothetical protein Q4C41_06670 [Eggerthellaceae bacterium]|nr:hypothetical protein [Eggerthellaceae bacterium]
MIFEYAILSFEPSLDELAKWERDLRKRLGENASGIMRVEARRMEHHEFNAYCVLIKRGFNLTVKGVDGMARKRGKSSPDVVLEGARWELKCPQGENARKTIRRNLTRALNQMRNADPPPSEIRIILSALETSLPRGNVEYHVRRIMDEEVIDDMIVIYSEQDVRRYKRMSGDSHCPSCSDGGVSPLRAA